MAEYAEGVWLHSRREVSIVELADDCGVPVTVVRELVEYGALQPTRSGGGDEAYSAACAAQVRSALRLCQDLELESAAIPLVFSLLERIHELEERLRHLSAQVAAPHRRPERAP
jgi:DNA-binding transcriptional MerR regulator